MKIAFRVDASSQIGIGHFMRCLTLADALKQRGAQIRFLSRYLPEHLKDVLMTKEHQFVQLNSSSGEAILDDLAHAHWLGASQHVDAQGTVGKFLRRLCVGVLECKVPCGELRAGS